MKMKEAGVCRHTQTWQPEGEKQSTGNAVLDCDRIYAAVSQESEGEEAGESRVTLAQDLGRGNLAARQSRVQLQEVRCIVALAAGTGCDDKGSAAVHKRTVLRRQFGRTGSGGGQRLAGCTNCPTACIHCHGPAGWWLCSRASWLDRTYEVHHCAVPHGCSTTATTLCRSGRG